MKSVQERLQEKYQANESGCWEWTGARNQGGYGRFRYQGRMTVPHRVTYELVNGPIPPGMDLDHLCRNRACVNPAHLEPVTRAENLRRGEVGRAKLRVTHCPQRHPYDATNTRLDKNGWRQCRKCRRGADRRRTKKKVSATS